MNINMTQVVQFEVTVEFFFHIIQLILLLYAYNTFSDCDKSVAKFNNDKQAQSLLAHHFHYLAKKSDFV